MKHRIISALSSLALCATMLTGCGASAPADTPTASDDQVSVVCATFPAYDWAREVVGDETDHVSITYLMNSGVDLHSYQPTIEDIAKVADADLFIYVGGESDEWAEDALASATNPDQHAISMLEAVGSAVKEEEVVECMEAEHDHEEGEEHEEGEAHEKGEEHEEGPEYDEHVWLSLRNAQVLVDAIADELSAIDPDAAEAYAANAAAYNAQLAELDERCAASVAGASHDTLLVADRFPFRYLVDDYGLSYYAAFVGCSAETEASFETVAFLADRLNELKLPCVLVIENSDQRVAQTVIETAGAKDCPIKVMDSLQSTTTADVDAGKIYLGAMEDNLDVLLTALS